MSDLESRVTTLEESYRNIMREISEIKSMLNPKMDKITKLETDVKWLKYGNRSTLEKVFFIGLLILTALNLILTYVSMQ